VIVICDRHTASLLVSRFNHTRTARLSGSEGRTPAHRPPLFACIDGHALARQTHICSSDRGYDRRIGHTQRDLDGYSLSCSSFKVGTQFPPRFWPLSRGSALSTVWLLWSSLLHSAQPHLDERACERMREPLRQTHLDTITAVTTNFLA
jgi:hypothetical protein